MKKARFAYKCAAANQLAFNWTIELISGFFTILWLVIGGIFKVFLVLTIIIILTHYMITVFAPWTERKWPEPVKKSTTQTNTSNQQGPGKDVIAAITAAVVQATGGKGVPDKISKQ